MPSLLLLLVIISSPPAQAAESGQAEFVGCINHLPDGTLQLGIRPSGEVYSIAGSSVIDHVNQLVRVSGHVEPNEGNIPKLTVRSLQVIADTCTAGLAAANPQTVEGKAGEGQVAIPVTTTAAEGTTPGFQTEGAMIQLSGTSHPGSVQSELPAKSSYLPPRPAQIAESESAANVNAVAAARCEILPGTTLGVDYASRKEPVAPAGAKSKQASPPNANTVGDITREAIAKPGHLRVNVRVGEIQQ